MESNKLDTQIKKQLSLREIAPTPKSWEQLRKQLDANDKKSTISFWWLGIAASIIAGIVVASLVFTDITNQNEPTLVETKQEPPITNKQQMQVVTNDTKTDEKKERTHPIKISKEKSTIPVVLPEEKENNKATLLVVEDAKALQKPDSKEALEINQKVEEIFASISNQDTNNAALTDAEVDSLLMDAATKIWKKKQGSTNREYVSASELLNSVEEELDQTFRDRIFEMLKEGFLKTKEALANRNN
ncbi:MAG: hypothetical protein COZ75_08650 [Flavobacteriaceae bacterium CG_4_8_14_3_um_filter_34_10]|nr:hypothetical protein [Flavobacteriia bacterium]PIQ18575.1 MAG: hypothetical protein COW66_05740 [Flavobacteriaceae bacterium CG18_big_fil_WC_8_21_14_2_50_34_36]PIX09102.1 MAG: hypothetical protein COZ75_08650 [Flavobacteriaceae bacterium CG_4_8_14_3_um_filter_34_10]PJC08433.1 MAG: hypothetical protein CO068_00970 [Flavobacteriaceae bacterium CG_4_9_14_0_8_um_filter_34_30]